MPVVLTYVLVKIEEDLDNEENVQKYGNLYRDFNRSTYEERRDIFIHVWIFFLRRLFFVLLTVFCFENPVVQVAGQIVLTLITVSFLLHQGIYKDKRRLFIEVLNEQILLIVSILMLHALLYDSAENRVLIGWSILVVLGLLLLANIVYIVVLVVEQRGQKKLE